MDSKHGMMSSSLNHMMYWMILDGIGLTAILVCTIFEGIDLWEAMFSKQWEFNQGSLLFWFAGRSLQCFGISFLITHAATYQIYHTLEYFGMALLTIGPLLNLFACSLIHFHSYRHGFVYRRKWMIAELLELVGILFLDLSCVDTKPYLVLMAEVLGFGILAVAASLELIYLDNDLSQAPIVSFRSDPVHVFDCLGLLCLTIVGIAQYRMKVIKVKVEKASSYEQLPVLQEHKLMTPLQQEKPALIHRAGFDDAIGMHGDIIVERKSHHHNN